MPRNAEKYRFPGFKIGRKLDILKKGKEAMQKERLVEDDVVSDFDRLPIFKRLKRHLEISAGQWPWF